MKTLVVLGGNPAYDAPADLDFAAAAGKAEELVHFGSHVDETAALASWHLPSAHFLESWGDARASCGTLSVVQPLILPLYGARSAVEVLGLLASGEDKPGHDLVQATWRGFLGEADFEKRWNRVLHDGVLPESALPGVKLEPKPGTFAELRRRCAGRRARATSSSCSRPARSSHDGASANNAWLQELPDAITKVTWDNPLLVSPATAAARQLEGRGRRQARGRPAAASSCRSCACPGLADGTLVLSLGYGRTQAGRVGNGVGFDAYRAAHERRSRPRDRREAHARRPDATRSRRPRSTARWRAAR